MMLDNELIIEASYGSLSDISPLEKIAQFDHLTSVVLVQFHLRYICVRKVFRKYEAQQYSFRILRKQ